VQKTDRIEEEEESGDDDKVNEELREGVNEEVVEASDDEYTDSESCEEEEDDDENNDIGWITPENLAQVKIAMAGTEDITEKPPTVACVTSDFAMQVNNF
jgi:RNA-binding protein NOB1